jgi:hypothetical protein
MVWKNPIEAAAIRRTDNSSNMVIRLCADYFEA